MAVVPTSANVRSYAAIVHEKAVLRRLIKINEGIANDCYAGKESLETILADTELQVIEVQIGAEISVDDKHKYEYRKD